MFFSKKLASRSKFLSYICIVRDSIITLIGIVVLVIGIKDLVHSIKYITYEVEAKVIYYDEDKTSSRHSRYVYAPVWEYEYEGNVYRESSNTYSSLMAYYVGEVRSIYINPDNPEEIRDNWNGYFIIALVVVGAMFFGILSVVKDIKDLRELSYFYI